MSTPSGYGRPSVRSYGEWLCFDSGDYLHYHVTGVEKEALADAVVDGRRFPRSSEENGAIRFANYGEIDFSGH